MDAFARHPAPDGPSVVEEPGIRREGPADGESRPGNAR